MNWNYYALLISILKGYTPEQAFEALEEGKPLQWVDKGQAQEMSELRDQGYKYKEIGAMFNVSADVAFKIRCDTVGSRTVRPEIIRI